MNIGFVCRFERSNETKVQANIISNNLSLAQRYPEEQEDEETGSSDGTDDTESEKEEEILNMLKASAIDAPEYANLPLDLEDSIAKYV